MPWLGCLIYNLNYILLNPQFSAVYPSYMRAVINYTLTVYINYYTC